MKKTIALVTVILMVLSVLSLSSCGNPSEAIAPDMEGAYTAKLTEITNLGNDARFGYSKDSTGLAVVSIGYESGTSYKLYDLVEKSYVEGAEVFIPYDDTLERSGIRKIRDGLFYSYVIDADGEYEYTLYTRDGKVEPGPGAPDLLAGMYIAKEDGTRYYIGVDGKLKTEKNVFAKIISEGVGTKLDDFYIHNVSTYVWDVFDSEGNYTNTLNLLSTLEAPLGANVLGVWTIGNRLFCQYVYMVADDESDYSVYVGENGVGQKLEIVTAYYDFSKGNVKTLDGFEYVVKDSTTRINDENIIISGYKIIDKQLSAQTYVQAYNKDGKVSYDLQKLVSGANKARVVYDYLLLSDDANYYAYKGEELIGKFPYSGVGVNINTLVKSDGTKNSYYSFDGELIDSAPASSNNVSTSRGISFFKVNEGNEENEETRDLVVIDYVNGTSEILLTVDNWKVVSHNTGDFAIVRDALDTESTLYFKWKGIDPITSDGHIALEETVKVEGKEYLVFRVSSATSADKIYVLETTYPTYG